MTTYLINTIFIVEYLSPLKMSLFSSQLVRERRRVLRQAKVYNKIDMEIKNITYQYFRYNNGVI